MRTEIARQNESGPHTCIRQPSSLGNFLYGCLQISGIHVSFEVKLGSRVVSEQEIKLGGQLLPLEESRNHSRFFYIHIEWKLPH